MMHLEEPPLVCSRTHARARYEVLRRAKKKLRVVLFWMNMQVTMLQKVPLFKDAGFTDQRWRWLALLLKRRQYEDGEYIITQGEMGSDFFLLAEGEVRILVNGKQVAVLKAGAFFGVKALIEAQPRNADVVAMGRCQVDIMTQEEFQQVYKQFKAAIEAEQRRRELRMLVAETAEKAGSPVPPVPPP